MGFLGFNSIAEGQAKAKRREEAQMERMSDPAYQKQERLRLAKKFAPQYAQMLARNQGRPVMKINRPSNAGKFLKVAPSVAVPIETMGGM